MKQFFNSLKILTLLFLGIIFRLDGQISVYSEDFLNQNDAGIGSGSSGLGGVTWSIDQNGANLGASGYVKVVGSGNSESLEWSDVTGDVIWSSPKVYISGSSASLRVDASNNAKASGTDGITAYYRVNSGALTSFGTNYGKNSSASLTVSGIGGDTLSILVYGQADANNSSVQISEVSISVTTRFSVQDGPWTNTSTWFGGIVPSSKAIVNNAISVSSNTTLDSLTVGQDGTIDVAVGSYVLLNDHCSNNGSITMNSDATGYAQLKVDGTVTGSGTYTLEQYVNNAGWYNLSMPMDGTLDAFGTVNTQVASGTRNIYTWDESTESWVDVVGASDGSTTVNSAGQGYCVYVGTNGVTGSQSVISLSGTSIYTSAAVSITRQSGSGGPNQGWNLIANPFTCGLDFSSLSKANVNNAFSVYDKTSGTYLTYAQSGGDLTSPAVAPMQAFWVRAIGAAPNIGSMSMSANGDVAETPALLKNQNVIADKFSLRAYKEDVPQIKDHAHFAMIANTSDGNDAQWDAFKRLNQLPAPSLMSVSGSDELAVNAFDLSPLSTASKQLQLRFVGSSNKTYFIELNDALLTNEYEFILEDRLEKKMHRLNGRAYKFVHQSSGEYRFTLHVRPAIQRIESHQNPIIVGSGTNGGLIYLKSEGSIPATDCEIYDLNGRRIFFTVLNESEELYKEIDLSQFSSGIYSVVLSSPEGQFRSKIFVP